MYLFTLISNQILKNKYQVEPKRLVDIKGKGEMSTYFLSGKLEV